MTKDQEGRIFDNQALIMRALCTLLMAQHCVGEGAMISMLKMRIHDIDAMHAHRIDGPKIIG